MKLNEIDSADSLANYIEGCLNDFESDIATKKETAKHIGDLIVHLLKKQENGHNHTAVINLN